MVRSVQVLPTHTNHMGNTFGGQIMAWMAAGLNRALSSVGEEETAGQGGEDGCLAAPQAEPLREIL